ncbi:MAG TPA: tetratricopeptide repeat protein [Anaerolineales bacterium]|nr:tetratricopeptide repeat protein [Anaerolineales bacterium]
MAEVSFGEWLRRQRKARGLTQKQLALQVSCSTSAIKKIEGEERYPSAQIVERLAEIFKIPENERISFLRFARGDWKSAPNLEDEEAPWRASPQALTHPPRSNLPVPLTSFVGRGKELKEIAKLLSTSRLLTLTGTGGMGKTRLAIQTANDSIDKCIDGMVWVSLVGLSDENLIPQEIAQSLNVREISNEPLIETLKTYLKTKDLLLVVDNCEHLIKACAQYVEQLLAACPKLKILATSTESLGLFNETIWQVPSLPLPEMRESLSIKELQEFASIELFAERASRLKPGFILDERNASFVVQICRRLDGIPLAIELAAARIKVLSVDEIAARLDDRFSLLTAGSRTAIPRHQTLRAAIDWSFDLLTEPERILFRRLSVFASGFAFEGAVVVCSQGMKRNKILDLLGRLVDKSLVIVEPDLEINETRYRLLETIRQYALEKLIESGETPAIRDQHLKFYVDLAERSEPNIFGSESTLWFARLDKEIDNIREAMEWATNSRKAMLALRMASALVEVFFVSRPLILPEWHDRIQQALSRPEGRARTLIRAKALNAVGYMYWADTSLADKRAELEEALSIGKEFGDKRNIVAALRNLGLLESMQGNYAEARSLLEQSLEVSQEMDSEDPIGKIWSLHYLGDIAFDLNEAERARSLYEEAISMLREIGEVSLLAYSVRRLGQLACRRGDYESSISLCKESLSLNQEISDLQAILACLVGFAAIALALGKLERAARLMAAVETQLASFSIRLLALDKKEYERNLALLRRQLDEKTLINFWAKGNAMTMEQAIAYALEPSIRL